MKDGILEVAMFRLTFGAEREDFLRESDAVGSWLREQSEFLDRTLLNDGDQWIDLVRWRSREDAERTAQRFLQNPALGRFMALIDRPSSAMYHAQTIATY